MSKEAASNLHPGTESDLVTIRDFPTELEATIVKTALDAFGIECIISRDDCGGQRPSFTMSQGVRVVVRAEDVERAEEVLADRPAV